MAEMPDSGKQPCIAEHAAPAGQMQGILQAPVLEAMSFPVRVADADTNWTFVNAAAEKLFGIRRENMLGKPCDHNKFCICGTENCSLVRAKRGLMQTFFSHEGSSYRVDVDVLKNPDGTDAGYIEMVHDITEEVLQRESLKNTLNGMDALVTVCSLEDGRILFLNDSIRKYFGIKGDGVGQVCYKLLQGLDEPCEACPFQQLRQTPEKVIVWDHLEVIGGRLLHKTARVIDWPGAGKAHLEYAIDITALMQAEEKLARRDKAISTLNRAAVTLLSQNEENYLETMSRGVGLIAGIVNVDRVLVFCNTQKPDGMYASQIFWWSKETGSAIPARDEQRECSYERQMPRWRDVLAAGKCVNGPVRQMPEAAALEAFGCVSVLAVPILNKGHFWGFVLFEDLHEEREYTPSEIEMLHSASFMLANAAIRNEEAMKIRVADEHMKLMLEAMPLNCVLWDKNHVAIDCSNSTVEMYGFSSKEDCLARLRTVYPARQPDGKSSDSSIYEMIDTAFRKGGSACEWLSYTLDGIAIPLKLTMKRIQYRGDAVVAGYALDLREQKRMLGEIDHKNQLLQALNQVSATMLESGLDTFDNDVQTSLAVIANAVKADRAYLWKNETIRGKLHCIQTHEWPGDTAPQQGTGLGEAVLFPEPWHERLSGNRCVSGVVRDLSGYEREYLDPKGVLSVIAVPVFISERFWGFISFDDCHCERRFSGSEEAILRSAGKLIAGALVRHEMQEALRASRAELQRKLADALAQITQSPALYSGNLEESAKVIAWKGCDALQASRIGIWNFSAENAICRNIVSYDMHSGEYFLQADLDLSSPGMSEYIRLLSTQRQIAIADADKPNVLTDILSSYAPEMCATLDSPVRIDGKLAGVVCVEQYRTAAYPNGREWTIEEMDFVSSLADLMTIAGANAAQRNLSERTEEMLDNLPGMVYRYRCDTAKHPLTFVSRGSIPLLGRTPDELLGDSLKTLFGMVHPDDLPQVKMQHIAVQQQDWLKENVFRIVLSDGSIKWVWSRARVIEKNEDDLPCLVECFCTDVTEQHFLRAEIEQKASTIFDLQDTILQTIAQLVEYRDDITGGHVERTRAFLQCLLSCMYTDNVYLDEISTWDANLFLLSSQLHDVGKIAIKDEILMKPGSLTPCEYDQMKTHVTVGVEVIEKISLTTPSSTFLDYAKILAATHHERWDGTGYPKGLKGTNIPLMGRMMALADVYDAITNERPYKRAFSHEEAVEIIRNGSKHAFDPELVKIFLKNENIFKLHYREFHVKQYHKHPPETDGLAG